MRMAFIPPINNLGLASVSNFHMALTHLVQRHGHYADYYSYRNLQHGDYIVLDNSVVELGSSIDIEDILHAAVRIGASEIILPDVFDDAATTLKIASKEAPYVKSTTNLQVMAVAQGRNYAEFSQCVLELLNMNDIDIIGIPKRAGALCKGAVHPRFELMRTLQFEIGSKILLKKFHMLGSCGNPYEAYHLSQLPWIRSLDTQVPFAAAYAGIIFHVVNKIPEDIPRINLETTLLSYRDQIEAGYNVTQMLRWANSDTCEADQPVHREIR